MSIGDAIASTIMQGSAQRSATLERGFEGMARGIERGQEFAFKQAEAEKERIADAPVKGAQRREAHARASVFELQAEDARRAAIEERDVQNVYERVTKRYLAANPKATKPPAAEIARELFAMGKYKQGQAALDADADGEVKAQAAMHQSIINGSKFADSLSETMMGIKSIPDDQQRDQAFKTVLDQLPEQFGPQIKAQIKGLSTDVAINSLVASSREAQNAIQNMGLSFIKSITDDVGQLEASLVWAKKNMPEAVAGISKRLQAANFYNTEMTKKTVVDRFKEEANINKATTEARIQAIQSLGFFDMNRKGTEMLPNEHIAPAVTAVATIEGVTGLGTMEAAKLFADVYVEKETHWYGSDTFKSIKNLPGIPVTTASGKEMFITKQTVDSVLMKNLKLTPETLYQATPEQRKAAFIAVQSGLQKMK